MTLPHHNVLTQVDTLESDCSKRHTIDYETCSNSTEVSEQKCTVCKVVVHNLTQQEADSQNLKICFPASSSCSVQSC